MPSTVPRGTLTARQRNHFRAVASGAYASESEVIRDGLRTLFARDQLAFAVFEETVAIVGIFYGGRDHERLLRPAIAVASKPVTARLLTPAAPTGSLSDPKLQRARRKVPKFDPSMAHPIPQVKHPVALNHVRILQQVLCVD